MPHPVGPRWLGARWIGVHPHEEPTTVLRFLGIDYIFLYQFVVYLAVWLWALCALVIHGHVDNQLFLLAPPAAFVGYLFDRKWGIVICAAGDAAMAYGTGFEAWLHRHDSSFLVVATLALSACMLGRFIRDLVIFTVPQSKLDEP